MTRREFLKTGAAGALAAAIGSRWAFAEGKRPPNIILVLADDTGLSRLGCYGSDQFKTPHLDKLAATGLKFERCYSMPLCGPTRAVILTGKYPFRTGATDNSNSVFDRQAHVVFPKLLQQAGYATCAIGKLGQIAKSTDAKAPADFGFDEYMMWIGRGSGDRYWSPEYSKNGTVIKGDAKQYGPDLTHEFLVDFLNRHREKPFFVYYSTPLTHAPFAMPPGGQGEPVPAMVTHLDNLMGQLVAELENQKLRDNTIILFTTDPGPHGNPLGTIGGKPMIGAKHDLEEGGVREPLIVNCPGLVPAGKVCADLTDFTDFYPTFLELAGAKVPDKLDGQSLAPQLLGKPGRPREWVYAQVGNGHFIANRQHKLYGDGRFVDISDSPFTEKPVEDAAAREKLATTLKTLRGDAPATPAGKEKKGKRK